MPPRKKAASVSEGQGATTLSLTATATTSLDRPRRGPGRPRKEGPEAAADAVQGPEKKGSAAQPTTKPAPSRPNEAVSESATKTADHDLTFELTDDEPMEMLPPLPELKGATCSIQSCLFLHTDRLE